ncbi:GFA family protein [Gluconacetobacter sacchari]
MRGRGAQAGAMRGADRAGAGMMEGGCLCRAVRYIAEGEPTSSGICHCETCRRAGRVQLFTRCHPEFLRPMRVTPDLSPE